jgi:hypothetical protein
MLKPVIVCPKAMTQKNSSFSLSRKQAALNCSSAILYWILIGIVLWVYGMIAFICLFIQWFHILVLGSRNEWLSNFARGYLEYQVDVMSYTYIMTDKRPEIFPVAVKIYEE